VFAADGRCNVARLLALDSASCSDSPEGSGCVVVVILGGGETGGGAVGGGVYRQGRRGRGRGGEVGGVGALVVGALGHAHV